MESTKKFITGVVGPGTAWLTFATFIVKGIGFLYIFLVLTHLTVFEYGVTELILTAVPLLSLFLLPGLSITVIADMGRERAAGNLSRMKGLLESYIKIQFIFSALAWGVVFFGAHLLAVWYGKGSTVLFFQIISFSFLIAPLRNVAQVLQSVYFAFRQQSVFTLVEEVLKVAWVVCFFYVFHLTILGVLLAVVLSQVTNLLFMSYPLFNLDRTLWRVQGERYSLFYFLRHHGKWGIFSNYIGTFGNNIRPWIINLFLGPQAVALFAVAQGLVGHTMSLVPLDRVVGPMLPQFVHTKERLHRLVSKTIKYECLGYFLAALAAGAGAPILIEWFFPQYVLVLPLFYVWLLVLIPSAFDAIFTPLFIAVQAQRNLFFASLYKVLLLVVLMPPFLYVFGILGIGYALVLVQTLYAFERYRKLKVLLPGFSLAWRDFITLDEDDYFIGDHMLELLQSKFGRAFPPRWKRTESRVQ